MIGKEQNPCGSRPKVIFALVGMVALGITMIGTTLWYMPLESRTWEIAKISIAMVAALSLNYLLDKRNKNKQSPIIIRFPLR
jgi:hypothetical protein